MVTHDKSWLIHDKLNLKEHIDKKLCKASKGTGTLKKLLHFIPKSALLTLYKTSIRTDLDHGDIIYDQLSNAISSIQYRIGNYQDKKGDVESKAWP